MATDTTNLAGPSVTVTCDGKEIELAPGSYAIRALKSILDVEPAKILALITHNGLSDQPDDGTIEIEEQMRFMTHARAVGSA